jgi:hypothetical protein
MHPRWLSLTALTLAAALAGCVVSPGAITTPAGGTGTPAKAAPAKKPNANLKDKPKAGDATALERLKASGRVQIAFKGLTQGKAAAAAQAAGASRPAGGGLVSANGANARKLRHLLQTTSEIARVEITLTNAKGFSQTQSLTREQLMAPWVTMFFEAVPAGETSLTAKVYDFGGAPIGNGAQSFTVERGQVTEVALNVKLAALGGVGATITFEDADVEEANITGHWVVGAGKDTPPYPMSGCGEGYVWFVNQYGNSLQASVKGYNDESSPDAKHRGLYWSEEAYGTIQRNKVQMTGRVVYTDEQGNMAAPVEEVNYELTFDPSTWQMRGQRNGQPGWAVPYTFDPGCGMPPPPPFPMPLPVPTAPPTWGPYPPYETPAPARPAVTVRGQVWQPDGMPAREGRVWFYAMDPGQSWSADAAIQPDGSYEVYGVPTSTLINIYASGTGGTSDGYTQFFGYGDEPETYDVGLYQECWEGGNSVPCGLASPVPAPWTPGPSWEPTAGPYPATPGPAPTAGPYPWTPGPSWTPTVAPYATPAPSASWMPSPVPSGLLSDNQSRYRLGR